MTLERFFDTYGLMLLKAIGTHLMYVVVSVSAGFVVALVLGVLLSRVPRLSKVILPVISIFQTIPGIVFIGVLFLWIGMVPLTVFIALGVYAVFPILKNTYVGILSVEDKYKEAARGCGMGKWAILTRVELPLAMPTIIAGVRMSAIYTVSWAVLSTMIGLGGLGEFIYRGINTNNNELILIGALPAALMAIGIGLLIDWIQKKVTPRGLQQGGVK
ncbi:ABC transporter permease [Feifania hominis]|uniref:ABC transporter permease n=1 Tax=Feifania hominis TaxID=2763660 RepID=A0A926HTZ2_9FIRM|nr:ABC transporter permease [Feifania hominis]MBC8535400.1 ABC transporter permease [Feifania hominis]